MPKKKTATDKTTKCSICGKAIQYKTKKPDKCPQCRNINKVQKSGKGYAKSKWKKESEMIKDMGRLFPNLDSIVNGYYSWLLSPKGMPMQLDWYCPDVKVAVELNGTQHYQYTKYFHKTRKEFNYLQECDALKAKLCVQRGVVLMSIPYGKVLSPGYLASELEKASPELYTELVRTGKINIKEVEYDKSRGRK